MAKGTLLRRPFGNVFDNGAKAAGVRYGIGFTARNSSRRNNPGRQRPKNFRNDIAAGLERVKGIEPLRQNEETIGNKGISRGTGGDHTQIRAQVPDVSSPDLAKVVAAWPKLSSPLKAAVLAIVNPSVPTREGEQ